VWGAGGGLAARAAGGVAHLCLGPLTLPSLLALYLFVPLPHPPQTLLQWQEKSRKHPAPAKAAGGGSSASGSSKQKYPSVGSSSSTTSKAEEEASCVPVRALPAAPPPPGASRALLTLTHPLTHAALHPRRLKLQLVNFEEGLLEEREEAILGIAQQISEVNETFRDLAQIVEEQGQGIDMLETNTGAAEATTKDGVGQLQEAEKHQKGYRKWILIMMLIIVLSAGGIAAWQVLEHQKK
jgi:hypothetical protein